ncbi:MAG TPA: hypothetical protein VFA11_16850 [Acidimicrobiales bacterium]|nr:hypothetical protein [Acidimicrobiales bacterium]
MRTLDRRHRIDWGRPPRRRRRSLRAVAVVVVVMAVLVAVGAVVQLLRVVPPPSFATTLPASFRIPGPPPPLPWPSTGQATIGVVGLGSFGSVGGDRPVPIASITKMMTAYLILRDHPVPDGAEGPPITMTQADVDDWRVGVAQGQSVVKVAAGEALSERQALEAILVASANNVAAALARWDAGSEAAFVAKMNAQAAELGMTHTHYADAIGLDAGSVSTATDLVVLAERTMAIPTFAGIVAEPQADLPVAGTVYNYDYLVGHDGFVGIKTGSTSDAGGCFVFAVRRPILGEPRLILGAVLSQRGRSELAAVLKASQTLADAAAGAVGRVLALPAGQVVGRIDSAWSSPVKVVTSGPATFVGWPGMVVTARVRAARLGHNVPAGSSVATVSLTAGTTTVQLPARAAVSLKPPPASWRLRHG